MEKNRVQLTNMLKFDISKVDSIINVTNNEGPTTFVYVRVSLLAYVTTITTSLTFYSNHISLQIRQCIPLMGYLCLHYCEISDDVNGSFFVMREIVIVWLQRVPSSRGSATYFAMCHKFLQYPPLDQVLDIPLENPAVDGFLPHRLMISIITPYVLSHGLSIFPWWWRLSQHMFFLSGLG